MGRLAPPRRADPRSAGKAPRALLRFAADALSASSFSLLWWWTLGAAVWLLAARFLLQLSPVALALLLRWARRLETI